ncbi:MAG TPA: transposase, partial [Phormidium sp.]
PPVNISKANKKQALEDEKIRNSIEGKFGQGKRRFSLNLVMAKLAHTSETAIAITFLVMNLSVILRQIFWSIFRFNYFFQVIDYHKLFVKLLTPRKLIYHSYSIS